MTPAQSLGRTLALTTHSLRLVLEERLREFDVTPAQFGILTALFEIGQPVSGRALARRLALRAQTVTSMLGPLEARALIARRPSPTHGRIIEVSITRHGNAVRKKCLVRVLAVGRSMTKHVDPAEVERCIEVLVRIRAELERSFPQ